MLALLLAWAILTAACAVVLVLFLAVDEWQVRSRTADADTAPARQAVAREVEPEAA